MTMTGDLEAQAAAAERRAAEARLETRRADLDQLERETGQPSG